MVLIHPYFYTFPNLMVLVAALGKELNEKDEL